MRIAVKQFANEMEKRLKENDQEKGKEGWLECTNSFLSSNILYKLEDLEDSLRDENRGTAQQECVDIANYAMMIFDKLCRGDMK